MSAETEHHVQENTPGDKPDSYTGILQKIVLPKPLHPKLGVRNARQSLIRYQCLQWRSWNGNLPKVQSNHILFAP